MDVYKIPYTLTGQQSGEELAPNLISELLRSPSVSESGAVLNLNIKELPIINADIDDARKMIVSTVKNIRSKSLLLGGSHLVTYHAYGAFSDNNARSGLLVFDAHPDCQADNPSERGFLKSLLDEAVLRPEDLLLVGLREWTAEEYEFLRASKIKHYSMKEISFEGIEEVCNAVMAAARSFEKLYVSIDVDVLDPAHCPGTADLAPGGLTTRELIYFMQRIKLLRNIVLIDLVNMNPLFDGSGLTVHTAAKIIQEIV